MAWGCKCEHKVPDCAPYEWPMTAAECHGREDSCRAGCSDPLTQDVCFTACNRYYRCGRPGGLPSLLQTASPMELPAYDPPPSQSSQSSCSVQMLIAAGLLTLFMIY
ncbi:hypothetical protein BX666DRAFT_1863425 [Dichotomocladium elegans]|nr:hypothetical protein BX666DRAFT_1863425 [Dichotomocladium elegans]